MAGLEYTLDPRLFPAYTDFVREHLRFSIFSPLLAEFVRLTHLSVRWTLLIADVLTIWATLFAAREVMRRCVRSEAAQLAGVSLLAAWWTLPIAGTSLLLMDPYVTARSFSAPLAILAVGFALDDWPPPGGFRAELRSGGGWRPVAGCLLSLVLAALFHPLMAGYGGALVLLVRVSRGGRAQRAWVGWLAAGVGALLLCAVLQAVAPAESGAVVEASLSRYYWFLSQWHWFELAGLLGPLLVLGALLRWGRNGMLEPALTLIRAAIVLGLIAMLVAGVFAREDAPKHIVARLQPLRAFLFIYAVMALLLGAEIWQAFSRWRLHFRNRAGRVVLQLATPVLIAAMAAAMLVVQRESFPASPHIELPVEFLGRTWANSNPWVQAFLWARAHTARDALFALDAKYVNTEGEDAQTFRAIALRSALPDYSKDGGEASITPALAAAWQRAAQAQQGLSRLGDTERDARLLPLGATWMIVAASAQTAHLCPYANRTVKVCRLSP